MVGRRRSQLAIAAAILAVGGFLGYTAWTLFQKRNEHVGPPTDDTGPSTGYLAAVVGIACASVACIFTGLYLMYAYFQRYSL